MIEGSDIPQNSVVLEAGKMKSLSSIYAGSLALSLEGYNRRRFAMACVLCFLVAVFCASAFAQEATILGTITDPSGAAIPNVTITLVNTDTGISRTASSNSDGQYAVPELHIGHYDLRAQANGFKADERKGVVLNVGDRERVDFKLEVGNVKETVTVEANAVAVQTDTGEVSGVVTGQQISQLATDGRSVFSLEALSPGASSIQADFMVPTSGSSDFNVSFNGQRVSHNLWLIDGGESDDRGGGGGSIVLPSEDAIAEFRTMTSNYSAEYGLSTAGTISMVIKSGTSKFHATAFYFGRNDALDARNYFNPPPNPVAELRLDDFGFNVGGPVALHESGNHKTFFFYNMEWRRYIAGGIFNQTVPLTATYGGNFASEGLSLADLHAPFSCQLSPTLQAQWATAGQALSGCSLNSQGVLAPNTALEASLTNNAIPSTLLDPNAQLLLSAGIFPAPTSGNSFIGGGKQPTTAKDEIARIDHQFNDKFSIFGHWISDQVLQTFGETMWSGDNVPTVGNTYGNPSYSAVVHATYTIHPNLLNEIAFNYDGNRIHILPQGVYAQPTGFSVPQVFTNAINVDNRIPDVHLSGSTGSYFQVNWLPWNNTANDYQIRDDLSWVRGTHQFKFGGGWAIYKKAQDYFAETQGGFGFNGNYTGNDFADFLIGYAQSYSENAYKGTGYWNAISPEAFIQDNWRATHRLTLNLGLRWDGIPHTYEANSNQANFYPNLYNPANAPTWVAGTNYGQISPSSPGVGPGPSNIPQLSPYSFYLNGMGIGGKNGIPKGLANNEWWNFGPRLGFAYDLFGTGKTVFRGGYGLMYERIQGNDMYNGATNPPFGDSYGTNNVLFSNPAQNIGTGATVSTTSIPIVPASVTGINQNYPAPRTSSYSAGVQQSVGTRAVFSISYVGSVDRHESFWQEINLPPSADLGCLTSSSCPAGTAPFNGLVPYLGYTQLKMAYNEANSHYNSLQTELRGQVTRDLTLQAAYTLSKAIDPSTGSSGNGWDLDYITNPYQGWQYDVGPSVLNRTNVFFVNFVYELPFFKNSSSHLLKTAVGGWELSGIVTAESGAPFNLGVNGQNVASIFPGGDVGNRPDVTGPISYPKTKIVGSNGQVTGVQWVNAAAFSTPAPGAWGNLGFDALTGPGRDNWNLALFKNFVISESRGSAFQFRAESFNTWNHTQLGGAGQNGGFSNNFPTANLTQSNFGQVTSAFDPRVFQLGAKLIF
jgi:hypothetical protein